MTRAPVAERLNLHACRTSAAIEGPLQARHRRNGVGWNTVLKGQPSTSILTRPIVTSSYRVRRYLGSLFQLLRAPLNGAVLFRRQPQRKKPGWGPSLSHCGAQQRSD